MDFILKGNIVYSKTPQELSITESGYLVCEDNICRGIFFDIPGRFAGFELLDYGDSIIIPGFYDLHTHAPQYAYRGLGMDLELLEWLNTYTYPEEAKYADIEYAGRAYADFVNALTNSATVRACIFATSHLPATLRLMDMLEDSGLITCTGLVNMDRNCPGSLCVALPDAAEQGREWIKHALRSYKRTKPILTPRFIPSCTDSLLDELGSLQKQYSLPVQSHLSENESEIKWVLELCPDVSSYAQAYERFGLFGGSKAQGAPAVMAHCVRCSEEEISLIESNGVYIAHCPASNMNIASGIAPVRKYLSRGLNIGLGSDIAGGTHLSISRALTDAVQVSKLYWRLLDNSCAPLTFSEAFYLATAGGGSFFGNTGSFEPGYEFDAVIFDDSSIPAVYNLTIQDRLERIVYLGDDRCIKGKYVNGRYIGRFGK